jgi:prepilin-type N-terminal cleavage/methylation domain-containing protein
MKKTNFKKLTGFTLIELMVVITIIGILAIIVLPNLTSVRGRGQDTAVKEQLTQFRATAAMYYDDNYGYSSSTVATAIDAADCLTGSAVNTSLSGTVFGTTDFLKVALGIKSNSAAVPKCYLGANTVTKSQSWAIVAQLRSGGYWCVDSAGSSKAETGTSGVITSGEAVCP